MVGPNRDAIQRASMGEEDTIQVPELSVPGRGTAGEDECDRDSSRAWADLAQACA